MPQDSSTLMSPSTRASATPNGSTNGTTLKTLQTAPPPLIVNPSAITNTSASSNTTVPTTEEAEGVDESNPGTPTSLSRTGSKCGVRPKKPTPAKGKAAVDALTNLENRIGDLETKIDDERHVRQDEHRALHEFMNRVGGPEMAATIRAVDNLNGTVSSLSAAVSELQKVPTSTSRESVSAIEHSVASLVSANNVLVPRMDELSTAVTTLTSVVGDISKRVDITLSGQEELRNIITQLQRSETVVVGTVETLAPAPIAMPAPSVLMPAPAPVPPSVIVPAPAHHAPAPASMIAPAPASMIVPAPAPVGYSSVPAPAPVPVSNPAPNGSVRTSWGIIFGPLSFTGIATGNANALADVARALARMTGNYNLTMRLRAELHGVDHLRITFRYQNQAQAFYNAWMSFFPRPAVHSLYTASVSIPDVLKVKMWNSKGNLRLKLDCPEFTNDFDDYHILCYLETHLRPEEHQCIAPPTGFEVFVKSRPAPQDLRRPWGGVIVFVRKDLNASLRRDLTDTDIISLEIRGCLFVFPYIVPESSTSWRQYLQKHPYDRFLEILTAAAQSGRPVLVLTDANAHTSSLQSPSSPPEHARITEDRGALTTALHFKESVGQ
ncbi:hypothetical protein BDP27DRAFT_1360938 [Rhodocollybia butyracea]|uniref:Uncharacterized protein n=1 Tax=Rhodocollybia butyracea TaxID=206335 RepID=A0A9P5Q068_9AGAR|nr:hypothetical protein BDP27DRAFT_1360938 [Rhodocollybia butyracea]